LGLLNGVYGGIGQSLGSLIGGDLSRKMGIVRAFYSCAAVDGFILLAFLLYQATFYLIEQPSSATAAEKIDSDSSGTNINDSGRWRRGDEKGN
jgi:hypothetical protein